MSKKFINGNYYSWIDLMQLMRDFNNEEELWKDVKGYEGLYLISNYGNLRSMGNIKNRKPKTIKLCAANTGYIIVVLHNKIDKPKSISVHRLVAIHFIENPNNHNYVNHKDGNKQNNNVNNLEWVTQSYNLKHRYLLKNK